MKTAQDYLKPTVSGEMRGGFNSRIQDQTFTECMGRTPQGNGWGERSRGWTIADTMIREGKIFSEIKTDKGFVEFKCYRDGDKWCCIAPEFVNLQESDCFVFADTREEAIERFLGS